MLVFPSLQVSAGLHFNIFLSASRSSLDFCFEIFTSATSIPRQYLRCPFKTNFNCSRHMTLFALYQVPYQIQQLHRLLQTNIALVSPTSLIAKGMQIPFLKPFHRPFPLARKRKLPLDLPSHASFAFATDGMEAKPRGHSIHSFSSSSQQPTFLA